MIACPMDCSGRGELSRLCYRQNSETSTPKTISHIAMPKITPTAIPELALRRLRGSRSVTDLQSDFFAKGPAPG